MPDKYKTSCKKWRLNLFQFSSPTCWFWYLYSGLHNIILALSFQVSSCFLFERMITKHHYLYDKDKKVLLEMMIKFISIFKHNMLVFVSGFRVHIFLALTFSVSSCFAFERMITEYQYLHDKDKNSLKNWEK